MCPRVGSVAISSSNQCARLETKEALGKQTFSILRAWDLDGQFTEPIFSQYIMWVKSDKAPKCWYVVCIEVSPSCSKKQGRCGRTGWGCAFQKGSLGDSMTVHTDWPTSDASKPLCSEVVFIFNFPWKSSTSQDGVSAVAGVDQWIGCALRTKGSLVRFPVKAHTCVMGQIPSGGHVRGTHTLMFLSLSFSLLSPLSKNK